jgi:hypothetical protein
MLGHIFTLGSTGDLEVETKNGKKGKKSKKSAPFCLFCSFCPFVSLLQSYEKAVFENLPRHQRFLSSLRRKRA